MNFALSDEQEFLKEAARGALSRVKTVEAARDALDGGELPDLWPTASEAGWPGLLVSEEHGGAALAPLEAMLVFEELGRVLASVPLLGHLPASLLLDRGGDAARGGGAGRRLGARGVRARAPALRHRRRAGPSSPSSAPPAAPAPRARGRRASPARCTGCRTPPGADHLVVVARRRPRRRTCAPPTPRSSPRPSTTSPGRSPT